MYVDRTADLKGITFFFIPLHVNMDTAMYNKELQKFSIEYITKNIHRYLAVVKYEGIRYLIGKLSSPRLKRLLCI